MEAAHLHDYPELSPFVISNVQITGITIGIGAWGSVKEVAIPGALCAAKQIHDFLRDKTQIPVAAMQNAANQFVKECQVMSTLRHPNIVQFLGVCSFPGSHLPALVMERLLTGLHELLEPETEPQATSDAKKSFFPLSLKSSILHDVASGLAYLHQHSPPIIHRDLSARNVLLSSGMVAKIADLGMSRIVPHLRIAATMTKAPGAGVYMPPEALENKRGDETDVNKKGKRANQTFPCDLLAPNYREGGRHIARTELERREEYMKIICGQLRENHPLLRVIQKCLDFPEERPQIQEVLHLLEEARVEERDDKNKLQLMQQIFQKDNQVANVESVNEQLQHTIRKLNTQLTILQREKEELANEVATANAIANGYKEDFEKERSDRTRLAGKLESCERDAIRKAQSLTSKFQAKIKCLEAQLRKTNEELKSGTPPQFKHRKDQQAMPHNFPDVGYTTMPCGSYIKTPPVSPPLHHVVRGNLSLVEEPNQHQRIISPKPIIVHEYINCPPMLPSSLPKPSQSPVDEPITLKPPLPTPRLTMRDLHQSVSLPFGLGEEVEKKHDHNIFEMPEIDGSENVVEAQEDKVYDPFLECLYCNQKFRYGEIQKYRKHVNECSGKNTA